MKLLPSLILTLVVCVFIPTSPVFADDAKELQRANELIAQVKQLNQASKYDQAIEKSKEALAIRERVLGPDHSDIAQSLSSLADLFKTTGRYTEAEPLLKRALAIDEKVLGPEHPTTARDLNNLAELYCTTGRYAEAEPLYKRALSIDEKVLGPEHPDVATRLNNLAELYCTTGRYAEAEPLYKRALSIDEKVLGPEHSDVADRLNNLAGLYYTTGRYAEAETLYRRALSIDEKVLGPEHSDVATALNNLALIYCTTGRYVEAELLYQRALAIDEKALGPEHQNVATALNNLAGLYYTTGRYAEAEPLFKRTLAIDEKALGPGHPNVAIALNNLAKLYDTTGRYAEAESLYKRALAIDEKALGPEHPNVANVLKNLAGLYCTTVRYAEAESLYKRALAIAQSSGNPELLFKIQSNYSDFLRKQNSPEAAIFFGKQAVNTIKGLRTNVSKLGKETLKSYTVTVEQVYKRLANLLIEQGRLAEAQQVLAMLKEEVYFQYVRRSANSAAKLNTKAAFTAKEKPWLIEYEKLSAEAATVGKELGELREKLRNGIITDKEDKRLTDLIAENNKQIADFNNYIKALLKSLREDAEKQLKLSKEERDRRIEEVGGKNLGKTSEFQSTLTALGEGAVVLKYLILDDILHIILTTPDIQLARHSTITAGELKDKITALSTQLRDRDSDPRSLAHELYNVLIAPMAKELQQAKARTLMLNLDGALHYLPFAALYDGTDYLVKHYRIVMYSEFAKDMVALPAKENWQVGALGVSKKHPGFGSLPSVPDELSSIVKSPTGGVIPGKIYLDEQFTRDRLLKSAIRYPVVHIASHFRFTPGTEMDSFLLLGDGSRLTLDQIRNSGYFPNTELLTLSACETAMGSSGQGTEIEGFGALAMGQGVHAVIATLWPVYDESTALLMKEFYRLKEEKKLPKVEALRQAQLGLLNGTIKPLPQAERQESYAHPYFWAPFILMGNWK